MSAPIPPAQPASSPTPQAPRLFAISRPRFWIYVFGPYIVGLLIGAHRLDDLRDWRVFVFALYFLLPANLLIYGVNDIFDWETDRLNPKKAGYEAPVPPAQNRALWRAIALSNAPFIAMLPFCGARPVAAMLAFWFFSLFYSAPPIRAKTKPVVDSLFNVLYIFPGVFAYYLTGGQNVTLAPFIAAWLWAMAMHAYSAVPDISSDRRVGLVTVATLLGFRGTLWACLLFYTASALLAWPFVGVLALMLGAAYVGLMLVSLRTGSEARLLRVYRVFPWVNTLAGGALFWWVMAIKFL